MLDSKQGTCEKETILKELFEAFIDDATAKNLSKRTISYYEYCYKWLKKTIPADRILNSITKKDINNHIRFLLQTNKATSVNSHLTGLRSIFNYSNNTYGTNIKVKLIKVDKQPKPTYTDEELQRLLQKPDIKACLFSEYRDWVMTNVFMATGCRLGSCISLKVKDIDLSSNSIYFSKMKNRKALLLPLNKLLRKILIEYLHHTKFKPDEYLFPSSATGYKLNDIGLRQRIEHMQRNGMSKCRYSQVQAHLRKAVYSCRRQSC